MDWFDQVDELWRARGSVGEFDSAEEFRALLHVLIGHGNYEVVFDDSSRVCGFVSWLWVDDLSLDLLNAFGGWRNVYQLAIPLYGGRNLFVMHFISSRTAVYLRLAKRVLSRVEAGGRIASFGRFSSDFLVRVKR